MVIVPENDFKKQYGKTWDEIRGNEKNWRNNLRIWIRWIGPENSHWHNMRSLYSRRNPWQFYKNVWKEVSFRTTTYRTALGQLRGIDRESLELDIKFWLKYRKRDFQVLLKDPATVKEAMMNELADKNLEIGGVNLLTNETAITKQAIVEEAERRGWEFNMRDRKVDLVKQFIEKVAKEEEVILA
jgi:hypothetical protein